MTKLVVIGKNSYIGSRLNGYLAGLGVTGKIALSSTECNFLDLSAVQRFFGSLDGPEYTIIFSAAINKWVDNSYRAFIDNLSMVRHLIAGAQTVRINTIVYLSSVDVYGNHPSLPITEQSAINPDTWYALAKYVCEWMLLSTSALSCPVTALRMPGVYGKSPSDRSLIGRIVAHIMNDRPVPLTSGGNVRRDFVFVDDLCRLLCALVPLRYHGVLNVATGNSASLAEIVERVGGTLQVNPSVTWSAGNPDRDFDLAFDVSRLQSLLPEFRFSDLSVGVRSYLEEEQKGVV